MKAYYQNIYNFSSPNILKFASSPKPLKSAKIGVMKDYEDIDTYIASHPKDIQVLLNQIRVAIKKLAPKAEESISYGIPTFKLNGNLVHFAGYATHVGFYPGVSGINEFKKELIKYKTSKGTIQFSLEEPLPINLITKIVKFRLKQNTGKK